MAWCKWSRQEAGACDFKTYYELQTFWQQLPPAEVQLARIASALGLKTTATASRPSGTTGGTTGASRQPGPPKPADDEIAHTIQQLGMPVFHGPLPAEDAALLAGLPPPR